jgi:hypothetical protein
LRGERKCSILHPTTLVYWLDHEACVRVLISIIYLLPFIDRQKRTSSPPPRRPLRCSKSSNSSTKTSIATASPPSPSAIETTRSRSRYSQLFRSELRFPLLSSTLRREGLIARFALFVQYVFSQIDSSPPDVQDWHVPTPLLDLKKLQEPNWDLTMTKARSSPSPFSFPLYRHLCPSRKANPVSSPSCAPAQVVSYIDGIRHVKKIAECADATPHFTRVCIQHLLYYQGCMLLDIFQSVPCPFNPSMTCR